MVLNIIYHYSVGLIGSLIFHPLMILYGGQFVLAHYHFEGYNELLKTQKPLNLAFRWAVDGLTMSVHKHLIHSSMLFPIYCIFMLAISSHLMSISRFRGGVVDQTDTGFKEKSE